MYRPELNSNSVGEEAASLRATEGWALRASRGLSLDDEATCGV